MVDMSSISFYLGLKVERDRIKRTIKLSQPAYIDKVFSRFYLDQAHAVNTPMKETALLQPRTESQASAAEREKYQGITGYIMFFMVETRPDIAFAISIARRFTKNLGYQHTEAVKTILRYLKGSKKRGITYGGQKKLLVQGYSDSDSVSNKKNRKSTSGFIFILNGGPVSWCSKKQATVALSLTEAKYIALILAAKEAIWLRLLLIELGLLQPDQQHALIKVSKNNRSAQAIHNDLGIERREEEKLKSRSKKYPMVIPLKGNNQGSIALAFNSVFYSKTKYINSQHHYIRDKVTSKGINLSYVPTDQMFADGLTKALTHVKFHDFIEQMGMA